MVCMLLFYKPNHFFHLLLQALTRGPRPIEAHAHDPRRYVSGERAPQASLSAMLLVAQPAC